MSQQAYAAYLELSIPARNYPSGRYGELSRDVAFTDLGVFQLLGASDFSAFTRSLIICTARCADKAAPSIQALM